MENISYYMILIFVCIVFLYAIFKRTNAYEAFIDGATDSLKTGIKILPYLLSMYVAINVFRASGVLDDLIHFQRIPSELFIQGFFRPVSSHASLSMMLSIMKEYGADSKEGMISAILQGGSDTTIYVMGLYYGSVKVKKTRHSYLVGLICDCICFLSCMAIFLLFW